MLFSANINIDDTPRNVVVFSRVFIEGKTHYFDFKALLSGTDPIRAVNSVGDRVSVDSTPTLVYTTTEDVQSTYNFTQIYAVLRQFDTPVLDDIIATNLLSILLKNNPKADVTKEDIKFFYVCVKEFEKYVRKEVKFSINAPINFLRNHEVTYKLIQEINDSLEFSYKYINASINRTEFMRKPEDKVFIHVPSYEEVISQPSSSFIPSKKEIFIPYRIPEFFYPKYKQYLSKDDNESDIIGNSENNDLPIQENELEFYETLKELVLYGIHQSYPDKQIEECVQANVGSQEVRDFLVDMAVNVAPWNWMHTALYPIERIAEDDNDIDEMEVSDSSGDSLESSQIYLARESGAGKLFSGENELSRYILDATCNNIFAPCEAIIKLLRWGSRKPSRLKLDGTGKYYDLNTSFLFTQSGSFKNLEIIKDNGNTLSPAGIIMAIGKFQDLRYLKEIGLNKDTLNIPVGIIGFRSYNNGQEQAVYVSIIDFVLNMLNGNKDVSMSGVSYENNRIVVKAGMLEENPLDLDLCVDRVKGDANSLNVFYRTNEVKDMYMKYNVPISRVSLLSIVEDYLYNKEVSYIITTNSFHDHEDLVSKVNQYRLPVQKFLDVNICAKVLPIVLKVADRYNTILRTEGRESSLEDVLNFYKDFILASGFNGSYMEQGSVTSSIMESTNTNSVNKTINKLEGMSKFGENEKSVDSSMDNKNLFDVSSLIVPLEETDISIRLYDNIKQIDPVSNLEVIKAITVGQVVRKKVNGKDIYVFAKPTDKLTPDPKAQSNVLSLVKFVFDGLYGVSINNPEYIRAKFNDVSTVQYYTSYFSKRKW